MKTYKGMTRKELTAKIVEARVKQCREQNFKKFGNNDFARENENPDKWYNLYKTYPMTSRTQPNFSLVHEYERFYA